MHRRSEYFAVGLHDELAQLYLLSFADLCESLWIHDAGFFLYRHTKNVQWNNYYKPYLPIRGREKWNKIAARLTGSYFCTPGETEGKNSCNCNKMSFKGADLKISARIDIRRGVGLLNIKLKFNRQNVRLHAQI